MLHVVFLMVCVQASKNSRIRKIRLPRMKSKSKQEPTSVPEMEQQWYFNGRDDKSVITICEEHINKLEVLVAYCEAQFKASSKRSTR